MAIVEERVVRQELELPGRAVYCRIPGSGVGSAQGGCLPISGPVFLV